jgi:hypothetical protein
MIFSNKRSYIPATQNTTNNNKMNMMNFTPTSLQKQIPTMPFLHIPKNKNVAIVPSSSSSSSSESKKIKWGEPFWNLFHVLAEKVNENDFEKIRVDLLNLVFMICSNLPCPDCTTHAVQYMKGVNFNTIRTKEDLKNMFFHFHNSVNARKGYPIFQRGDLESKYKSGNILAIIDMFLAHFKTRPYSVKLFTETLQRDRVTKHMVQWFGSNLNSFR